MTASSGGTKAQFEWNARGGTNAPNTVRGPCAGSPLLIEVVQAVYTGSIRGPLKGTRRCEESGGMQKTAIHQN